MCLWVLPAYSGRFFLSITITVSYNISRSSFLTYIIYFIAYLPIIPTNLIQVECRILRDRRSVLEGRNEMNVYYITSKCVY